MWFLYWRCGQQFLYGLKMGKKTYNFVKNKLCLTYWWCNDGLSKQMDIFLTYSFFKCSNFQKQPSRGVLRKRCSENMQQIYRRTPMPKCDFNKVALHQKLFKIFEK